MPKEYTEEELRAYKEHALGVLEDEVGKFLYYDRKNDEDLPPGVIEILVKDGWLTVEDIVSRFREELQKVLR